MKIFIFRYYGYRNVNESIDSRIAAFQQHKDLFQNKDVLDIGCNIGHVTYIVARDFGPKSILGIDIDNSLINIARKNRRHYCNNSNSTSKSTPSNTTDSKNLQKSFENGETLLTKEGDLPNDDNSKESNTSCSLQFPDNISFIHVCQD